MVILSLEIAHFGKLKNTKVNFRPGMNVLTGENESGKTTIAHCIRAMFYGLDPDQEIYERYYPHDFVGLYGAKMTVSVDDVEYVIERSFIKERPLFKIVRLPEKEAVADPQDWLEKLLHGVNEAGFEETVFMSQAAFLGDVADFCLAERDPEEIRRESSIRDNFASGKEKLQKKKAELASQIDSDAADKQAAVEEEIQANSREVEQLNAEIPGAREAFETHKNSLIKEVEQVNLQNLRHEEELQEGVVTAKRRLAAQLEINALTKAGKNTVGVVLFIAFAAFIIAGGVLIAMGKASLADVTFDNPDSLVIPIFGIAALICLAGGIIATLIYSKKRNIEREGIMNEETLREELKAAEKKQQYYLDHKEEESVKVENRAEKEAEVHRLETALSEKESGLESRLSEGNELADRRERLIQQVEENGRLAEDIRAVELAMDSFEKLGDLRREQRLSALAAASEDILHAMNGDLSETISFTKEGFMRVKQADNQMYLNGLSTAAMQEVILAVRLAKTDILDPEKTLPLVIDDAFAHFDDDRLSGCLNYLKQEKRQVILLTCQTRERKML